MDGIFVCSTHFEFNILFFSRQPLIKNRIFNNKITSSRFDCVVVDESAAASQTLQKRKEVAAMLLQANTPSLTASRAAHYLQQNTDGE